MQQPETGIYHLSCLQGDLDQEQLHQLLPEAALSLSSGQDPAQMTAALQQVRPLLLHAESKLRDCALPCLHTCQGSLVPAGVQCVSLEALRTTLHASSSTTQGVYSSSSASSRTCICLSVFKCAGSGRSCKAATRGSR